LISKLTNEIKPNNIVLVQCTSKGPKLEMCTTVQCREIHIFVIESPTKIQNFEITPSGHYKGPMFKI